MTALTEPDSNLAALLDDLRARLAALNELYQPVYGGDVRRIAEQERQVEELRTAIRARRAELTGTIGIPVG